MSELFVYVIELDKVELTHFCIKRLKKSLLQSSCEFERKILMSNNEHRKFQRQNFCTVQSCRKITCQQRKSSIESSKAEAFFLAYEKKLMSTFFVGQKTEKPYQQEKQCFVKSTRKNNGMKLILFLRRESSKICQKIGFVF